MGRALKHLRQILTVLTGRLAQADIIFFLLPPLMILLVAGTLAQQDLGLYRAHQTFFSTFLAWLGPVPFPGGYTLLGLITLSLTCKFFFKSRWEWKKAGIILSHLGVLVLLFGGLITALSAQERYMVIAEGQQNSYLYDYHVRELSIIKDENQRINIPFSTLQTLHNETIHAGDLKLKILETCTNCNIQKRTDEDPENFQDMARFMALSAKAEEKEPEQNLSGLTFEIENPEKKKKSTYIAFEAMPKPIDISLENRRYQIIIGKKQTRLPFEIKLINFEKHTYPGTTKAREYSADIVVIDKDLKWPVRIAMNEPLRYKNYTFYQSSFEENENTTLTILSVVQNNGQYFPYIGTLIVTAGLILHLCLMTFRRSIITALLLCFLAVPSAQAQTQTPLDMKAFSGIPILHEGRIKPLDSFARLTLRKLSGHEKINDQTAISWLAQSLFDPHGATNIPVFQISHPALKQRLSLPKHQTYFSLAQLRPPLKKTAAAIPALLEKPLQALSSEQQALLLLHENTAKYLHLMGSFTAIFPLGIDLPKHYQTEENTTYFALQKHEQKILSDLKNLIQRKGNNPKNYSADERALATLAFHLETLSTGVRQNRLLKIFPDSTGGPQWQSPWQIIRTGEGSPQNASYIELWKTMSTAYRTGNSQSWEDSTSAANAFIKKTTNINSAQIKLEQFYNLTRPLDAALLLYVTSLCLGLLIATRPPRKIRTDLIALTTLSTGIICHISAIAARIYILQRAPVGTLYESIIFVAAICSILTLFLSARKNNNAALIGGTFISILMLLVAPFFIPQGDPLEMLVAVLNTNFWLIIHVLCITGGYALCVMSALFAHLYLWRRTQKSNPDKGLFGTTYRLSLAALLFTAVGTILGGIWADQSWGRFWGWDPKENGALLIVLWLIWLQHGRISTHLNQRAFAAGLCFLNVIVALAWFGVNLLGVGLHSYGFTSGIAVGLFTFCTLQTALIAFLLVTANKRKTHG